MIKRRNYYYIGYVLDDAATWASFPNLNYSGILKQNYYVLAM